MKNELVHRCSDEKFREETTPDGPYDWYNWRGLRYFLYEYETALASKQSAHPRITWDELRRHDLRDTIEHILPQSIDDQPYWKKHFRKRVHENYMHDLGNLTLTRHNSNYGNKPFPEKKGDATSDVEHCYAKSSLYVERELVVWDDWDTDAIDQRRNSLLEWARDRWAVELGSIVGGSSEPDIEDEPDQEPLLHYLDDGDGK